ncbi:major facilitator superfamily domain-containing protein [Xylogone sp. PMI_703]|nr:major facilitator superfamily domain-containing protein [Xylogone sp. PMI_703]
MGTESRDSSSQDISNVNGNAALPTLTSDLDGSSTDEKSSIFHVNEKAIDSNYNPNINGEPPSHGTRNPTISESPVEIDEKLGQGPPDSPELPSALDFLLVQDGHTYPEGGLRAWLVVLGSWCGMMASIGICNTLGSYQAYVSTHQLASYDAGVIGWIFSVYTFLTFACGVYIGPLFDVHGPRWLIFSGSICLISMQFVIGLCKEYYQFLLVFAVLGVGTSLLFTPCIAAVGHYFYLRRGTATGIAAGGGAMGGIVFPLMLQALIPRVGWEWSNRIIGFIFIFLCGMANLLVRSRLPPTKTSPHPDFRILRDPAYSWTVLGVWLIEWGLFIPLTYLTSYAINKGLPQDFSYQILPILNAGSVIGRWLPGYYADKIGRYNTAVLAVLFTIILIFAIWLPFGDVKGALILFSVLYGFASGSNISLTPVCVGQLCDTQDYGRYYATCYTIVSVGCLTGIPIAGQILVADGGKYWGLILWTGLCYVGAAIALGMVRIIKGGWGLRVKY